MIGELTIFVREGQTYALLRCQWCPVQIECPVNMEHIEAWRQGEMIQNAMPELSADLREMFISGTCPTCWNDMFPAEEMSGSCPRCGAGPGQPCSVLCG